MTVKNAKVLPLTYYGLHMAPGVAEYREPNQEPYRIFIDETCIKNMDPTFAGKPLYVRHVDDVNVDNLELEAAGYVFESFYNKIDGKHWVKFVVVSDAGHQAIRNGWTLSNAYILKTFGASGRWHGVDYAKEVLAAEYEHLALVPDPRYEESVILTPEEFKAYNLEKESELKKLANSKGDSNMPFNFFKKSKVENSADLESTSVVLPKSKKEMTITQLVNEMDKIENMQGYANEEHMVKVGNEEMSVGHLVNKYMSMCQEMEKMKKPENDDDASDEALEKEKNDDMGDEEAKKKALELAEHEEEEMKGKKKDAKKNDDDESMDEKIEKKKNSKKHFDDLKNAPVFAQIENTIDLPEDRVARGRARYGSSN